MKVALSVWKGRIAPVFDVSRELLVLELADGQVVSKASQAVVEDGPAPRERLLTRLDVQTLICGAVSEPVARVLEGAGIRVVPFVAGEVDEVIGAFAGGDLPCPRLSMPGCQRRAGAGRRRGGACGQA
jgi:predicted Fe-Mo cluster-binding NifX family protein